METEKFVTCTMNGVNYNCSTVLLPSDEQKLLSINNDEVLLASGPNGSYLFVPGLVLIPQLILFFSLAFALFAVRLHQLWMKMLAKLKSSLSKFSYSRVSFRLILNSEQLSDFCANQKRDNGAAQFFFLVGVFPRRSPKMPSTPDFVDNREIIASKAKPPIAPKIVNKPKEITSLVEKDPEKLLTESIHELLNVPKKPPAPSSTHRPRRSNMSPSLASAASAISALLAEKQEKQINNNQPPSTPILHHNRQEETFMKASSPNNCNSENKDEKISLPQMPPEAPSTPGVPPPPPPPPLPSTLDTRTIRFSKPAGPVKCFNWVPLPDFKIRGTVWEQVRHSWPCILKRLDLIELEEIFSQKAPTRRSSTPRPCDTSGRANNNCYSSVTSHSQIFSVIDSRRAHNLNILLSSAVRLPIEELVNLISTMDVGNALSPDVCSNLIRNFPTEEETRMLSRFRENLANFASADRFLWELSLIPRCSQKLSALVYRKTFNENVDVIRPKLEAMINCSRQMRESTGLKRALEITLAVGNFLNSFSRPKPMNGFKLSSLARLGDTKSSKRSTYTLIDYVRKVLIHPPICPHCNENLETSDEPAILTADLPIKISAEISDLKAASVGELGSLYQEIASLRAGMTKVETESQASFSLVTLLLAPASVDQVEKAAASEKAFKEVMALWCHNEGGKLVELEKMFEVAVDEYRRTLIYFGEADQSLDTGFLKQSIENGPEQGAEKEPSVFTIVERFVSKVEVAPGPMPPSFYRRK